MGKTLGKKFINKLIYKILCMLSLILSLQKLKIKEKDQGNNNTFRELSQKNNIIRYKSKGKLLFILWLFPEKMGGPVKANIYLFSSSKKDIKCFQLKFPMFRLE